jgi:hypothetical protein
VLKWPNYLYYGKEGKLLDEKGAGEDEDVSTIFSREKKSGTLINTNSICCTVT